MLRASPVRTYQAVNTQCLCDLAVDDKLYGASYIYNLLTNFHLKGVPCKQRLTFHCHPKPFNYKTCNSVTDLVFAV